MVLTEDEKEALLLLTGGPAVYLHDKPDLNWSAKMTSIALSTLVGLKGKGLGTFLPAGPGFDLFGLTDEGKNIIELISTDIDLSLEFQYDEGPPEIESSTCTCSMSMMVDIATHSDKFRRLYCRQCQKVFETPHPNLFQDH